MAFNLFYLLLFLFALAMDVITCIQTTPVFGAVDKLI